VPAVGADRAPQWPAQVSGSITHGQGWAAAVVASKEHWQGLGLDVEQCLASARAESLAAEILTDQELHRLAGLSPQERAWRISLTFSLKESLFKALYPLVLKHFYFHDAELLDLRPQRNGAVLRLLNDLNEDWTAGTELHGHYVSVNKQLLSLVSVG
jgi:enterobactin synthetase component D